MYFLDVAMAPVDHLSWLLLQKLLIHLPFAFQTCLYCVVNILQTEVDLVCVICLCHCMSKCVSFLAFATVQLRSPGIWYVITEELDIRPLKVRPLCCLKDNWHQ